MTQPKKDISERCAPPAGEVRQLTAREVDSLREEAKRDGAWAKLRLSLRQRQSGSPTHFAREFSNDIVRMRDVLASTGRQASETEVASAWIRYSRSLTAVWMHPPEDDDQLLERLLFELDRTPSFHVGS